MLAEGMAGTRYENCVKRKTPVLKKFLYAGGKKVIFRDESDSDYNLLIAAPDSKLNGRQVRSEQRQFAAALRKSGIPVRMVKLTDKSGAEVVEAEIYLKRSKEGIPMAGFLTMNNTEKQVTVNFPGTGHGFDLVSGRYLGHGKQYKAVFSKGNPLLVVQTRARPGFSGVKVNKNRLEFKVSGVAGTTVAIRIFDPSGKEIPAYGKRISVYNGQGSYDIPFAVSDAKGNWRAELCEVISNSLKNIIVKR